MNNGLKSVLAILIIVASLYFFMKDVPVVKKMINKVKNSKITQKLEKRPYFDIDILPLDQKDSDKKELINSSPSVPEDNTFEGASEPNGELTPHILN